jgi:hypothetical protein
MVRHVRAQGICSITRFRKPEKRTSSGLQS